MHNDTEIVGLRTNCEVSNHHEGQYKHIRIQA